MDAAALAQIVSTLKEELARRPPEVKVAIVGRTPAALDLVRTLREIGAENQLMGIYADPEQPAATAATAMPVAQLAVDRPDIVLIASDEQKEVLLAEAAPFLLPETKVLIGGFGHFRFRDALFEREIGRAFVPSLANGYPNSLIHIYQCLQNAARLGLEGVVAEFGMFKGGTTMLISRFIEALGQSWKVYGFDTFDGFPPPRSPLDMYAHPDCVYMDVDTVRRFFEGRDVEVVAGDVVETVSCLAREDIVLAFVDTDNYTSAAAVLDVILERVVPGGAILFDHFTGRDRFLYTLGERIAAQRILGDARYFNLHETGVFLRVR